MFGGGRRLMGAKKKAQQLDSRVGQIRRASSIDSSRLNEHLKEGL
ncbi:MAG: hypothetical protein JWO20_174 [Candidatus Angelobacter sp.]|nr:hypothetical protein [Candidatus Angelobacter sp.]